MQIQHLLTKTNQQASLVYFVDFEIFFPSCFKGFLKNEILYFKKVTNFQS